MTANFEELRVSRCNVQVEDTVREWYKIKARSMGMTMSQLMSYVVANWYETQQNAEAVRNFSELNNSEDLKALGADVRELLELFAKMAEDDEKPIEKKPKNGKK